MALTTDGARPDASLPPTPIYEVLIARAQAAIGMCDGSLFARCGGLHERTACRPVGNFFVPDLRLVNSDIRRDDLDCATSSDWSALADL
jgi:hypothetical protein